MKTIIIDGEEYASISTRAWNNHKKQYKEISTKNGVGYIPLKAFNGPQAGKFRQLRNQSQGLKY